MNNDDENKTATNQNNEEEVTWVKKSETETIDDDYIQHLAEAGEVLTFTNTETTLTNDKKTTTTETYEIKPALYTKDGKIYDKDGNEIADVKNGVKLGDTAFATVRKATTEEIYAKEVKEKKRKAIIGAILAVIATLGLVNGIAYGLNHSKNTSTVNPEYVEPEEVIEQIEQMAEQNIELTDEERNMIYHNLYEIYYQKMISEMDLTVIRETYDGALSADYDQQDVLQEGDLYTHQEMKENIVAPGAKFIDKVNEYKAKYDGNITPENYKEMLEEGQALVEEYRNVILEQCEKTVKEHYETTKKCIEEGKRGKDYENELKLIIEQLKYIEAKEKACDEIIAKLNQLQQNPQLVADIQKDANHIWIKTTDGQIIGFEVPALTDGNGLKV